jgi:hypothetical protein
MIAGREVMDKKRPPHSTQESNIFNVGFNILGGTIYVQPGN